MIGARFIESLGELAAELARKFPHATLADGTMPGVAPAPIAERDVKPENVQPGLVPCASCGTGQRPGAVHFASNTEIRPCAGSWSRR